MADYYPESDEAKEKRRVAFWQDRIQEMTARLDRWRSCPAPGCRAGRYRYSSRKAQWQHLVKKHGAVL